MRKQDRAQQSPAHRDRRPGIGSRVCAWWSRQTLHGGAPDGDPRDPLSADPPDVRAALRMLTALIDGADLPDGVVELVVEDSNAPSRSLLDVHEGHVNHVEPGSTVPWASIAGPSSAWMLALGPDGDSSGLRVTGEERLARRLLAALPRAAFSAGSGERAAPA